MAKYKIRRTTNSQFYWTFHADNQQVIITSETYIYKSSAQNGIGSSKRSLLDRNFIKKFSINGKYYFIQVADNNEPIGTSEMYETSAMRDHGLKVLQNNAARAETEDLT